MLVRGSNIVAMPYANLKPALVSNLAAHSSLSKSRSNDLTGFYFIAGKAPKGFENISELALDDQRGSKTNGTLNGFIHAKQKVFYKLMRPAQNGDTLSFTTISVRGISNQFTGRFLKPGNFSQTQPAMDEVVLKGHLIKMQGRRKVAESNVSFTYSVGG
jgi:hypothetical protein